MQMEPIAFAAVLFVSYWRKVVNSEQERYDKRKQTRKG